jgi:antitoxin component of MazEF toxin-antitoxin module
MHVVKVRRVGNSNVVTLPQEYEAAGYVPGTSVVVEQTPTGELLVMPEARLRDGVQEIGRRVIAEHREALDLLEAHDRGQAVVVEGELRRTGPVDGRRR